MKAIVIGATGLIGKALVDSLLKEEKFSKVIVFVRRSTGIQHWKLDEHLVDFDKIEDWKSLVQGDVLFSTLGTTLRTAGSKERQWVIDYDYQFNVAKAASENGVALLVLLSSAGANPKSNNFYIQMKGKLDEAVKDLGFKNISIIRPSMLDGNREEYRFGERFFTPIMKAFSWIPGIKKYRPIKDVIVAKAMINAAFFSKQPSTIYALEQVFELAQSAPDLR